MESKQLSAFKSPFWGKLKLFHVFVSAIFIQKRVVHIYIRLDGYVKRKKKFHDEANKQEKNALRGRMLSEVAKWICQVNDVALKLNSL